MKLLFLIKEGFAGFRRARLSASLAIVTIMLSLSLIGIFGILVQNLSQQFHQLYSQIYLEVYIDPSLSSAKLQALRRSIRQYDTVQSVDYISPDEAWEAYAKNFGEDIVSLLDENPLPPSFRVLLNTQYTELERIEETVAKIDALDEVDEVAFHDKLIKFINKYYMLGLILASVLGATIFFISTLLIFNTIRLTIHSRRDAIEIMRLVGATGRFIKAPFIIEGLLQGLIGGLLASGMLWLAVDIAATLLSLPDLKFSLPYFLFMIGTGMWLGLLGSYVSVGKYLQY